MVRSGRGRVVVSPARFPVVAAGGVNAEMGPAIWILRSGRTCTRPTCSPRSRPIQTVNQVPVGLLYRITGSPKVLSKGL